MPATNRKRRLLPQEDEEREPYDGETHAAGSDYLGLDPVGQLAGIGGESGLHNGLGHQDQTGALRAQMFAVLEIEADEKTDGIGGAVVYEHCEVR